MPIVFTPLKHHVSIYLFTDLLNSQSLSVLNVINRLSLYNILCPFVWTICLYLLLRMSTVVTPSCFYINIIHTFNTWIQFETVLDVLNFSVVLQNVIFFCKLNVFYLCKIVYAWHMFSLNIFNVILVFVSASAFL